MGANNTGLTAIETSADTVDAAQKSENTNAVINVSKKSTTITIRKGDSAAAQRGIATEVT